MSVKLYLRDPYLHSFDAAITKIEGNSIFLDRTAFYPTGGGQPGDTGTISVNGNKYRVTDTSKAGDDVRHALENTSGLKEGEAVTGFVDWEKRYAYMRYHTAIHIIDGIVVSGYADKGFSTGSQIYEDRARIDFDMDQLNRELAQKIIDSANNIVKEGRTVSVKNVSREEALQMPNLVRTEPGKELIKKLDTVRIVEIEGLDMQMDGGLHVANSKELGAIALTEFTNKGSHHKRIEIKLI